MTVSNNADLMDNQRGRTLRLLVLGVRAQKPRRYYLSFQVLAPGTSAATALPNASTTADAGDTAAALHLDEVCRTETASLGKCPEFINRAFVLRLPCALGLTNALSPVAGSLNQAGPRLVVSLFAAPSPDEPAGPVVAGKEVDQLVASGSLPLANDVAARLAAGERVMLPLQLHDAANSNQLLPGGLGGQAAQLQSLRSSLANATNNIYGSSDTQVLLELMLLDAEPLPLLSSSSATAAAGVKQLGSSALFPNLQQSGLGTSLRQNMGNSSPVAGKSGNNNATASRSGQQQVLDGSSTVAGVPEVVLSVLVSAAVNLPMMPGPDSKELVPPCAFVALKSAADAAAHRRAQAVTEAAPAGQNPTWSQLLHVSYPKPDLPHEQLHIAVVNEGTNRVLVKGCLPLSGLIPGQHYSLAVALSDACTLYITVVLGLGAKTQLDALQGSGVASAAAAASQLKLMQLRLVRSSQPLQSLMLPGGPRPDGAAEVWAVWRSSPRPGSSRAAAPKQQQQQQQLFTPLDCREGADRTAAAVLRGINGRLGLLSAAVVGADADGGDAPPGNAVVAALPVQVWQQHGQGAAGNADLWPPDHMVLLPFWMTNPVAAVLELHLQTYSPSTSSLLSSSGASNPSISGSRVLRASVCFARLELAVSAVAAHQSGTPFTLKDLMLTAVQPAGQSAAGSAGGEGAAAAAAAGKGAVSSAVLEAVVWDVADYVGNLKELVATQAMAATNSAPTWAADPPVAPTALPSPATSLPNPQGIRSAPNVFDTLVSDAVAKQQALERLQRGLDVAESRREVAACKIAELQDKNSRLTDDLQHLRQLLHDEKEAAAAAFDGSGMAATAATASREELISQLSAAAAAQAKERARNAELVHRLQQLHAEQIDVLELQKQYAQLQEAHYQQSQLLFDQEASAATIATLRKALADQEAVITRLEASLRAAVARCKELEGWRSSCEAYQAEVGRLRDELSRLTAARPAHELAEMASRAAEAAAAQQAAAAAAAAAEQAAAAAVAERDSAAAVAAAEFEVQLSSKEADRLSAIMRIEKAEAAATAAQNELMDVTKRYAREIAQLKTKLAEKDAQLLGGFGSLANLYLGETGPGNSTAMNSGLNLPGMGLNPTQLGALGALGPGLGLGQGFESLSTTSMWPYQQQPGAGPGVYGPAAAAAENGLAGGSGGVAARGVGDLAQQLSGPGGFSGRIPSGDASSSGRAGSPKLQPLPSSNVAMGHSAASPKHQQQQQGLSAGGYPMRAGTAEGATGKPGSPLAPLAVPRMTTSAEGLRSSSMNWGAAAASGTASPSAAAVGGGSMQQRQGSSGQQRQVSDTGPGSGGGGGGVQMLSIGSMRGAAAGGSPIRSGSPAAAGAMGSPGGRMAAVADRMPVQQQQQRRGMAAATATDAGEEGYEDAGCEDAGTFLQQQQQQQLQQQQQQQGPLTPSGVLRQQQQQQQRLPPGQLPATQSPSPAPKTGLRKWFG